MTRDVSGPPTGTGCCERSGKDGIDDLLLSFPLDVFLAATGAQPGDSFNVSINGVLGNGTLLSGGDCVVITSPGGGPAGAGLDVSALGKPWIRARQERSQGIVLIQYALPEAGSAAEPTPLPAPRSTRSGS